MSEAHSIGIIGGADGPTVIFVSGSPIGLALYLIIAAAAAIGLAWLVIKLVKSRRKGM